MVGIVIPGTPRNNGEEQAPSADQLGMMGLGAGGTIASSPARARRRTPMEDWPLMECPKEQGMVK
jgi:hypothetical protein